MMYLFPNLPFTSEMYTSERRDFFDWPSPTYVMHNGDQHKVYSHVINGVWHINTAYGILGIVEHPRHAPRYCLMDLFEYNGTEQDDDGPFLFGVTILRVLKSDFCWEAWDEAVSILLGKTEEEVFTIDLAEVKV